MTGIPCPNCGGTRHRTPWTRLARGKVLRVRRCLACGHQFRTAERVESNRHPTKTGAYTTPARKTA